MVWQWKMEGDEGWTIGLWDAQEVRHVGVIWYLCGPTYGKW